MPGTTLVPTTGNQDIDGLLGDYRWITGSLTFSFPTSGSFYGSPYSNANEPLTNFSVLNATQQAAVRSILNAYASVINVTFTEVTESASVHGDLRFAQSTAPPTAWAYPPQSHEVGGDSWYGSSYGYYATPVVGNYAWTTFLHEIGHTLGLEHGHTGGHGPMTYAHDSMEYSVMTYRSYEGAAIDGLVNEQWGFAQTLMMYDIAALQHMYGANFSTNSGATVYSWSPTTGQMFINGVGQAQPGDNRIFATIWDGGGIDSYDFSNYGTNLAVDLRPGEWTTTSNEQRARLHANGSVLADGNIANALMYNGNLSSLIENAYGGGGNDSIIGNVAANYLRGNGGDDALYGLDGDDLFDGGAGNDLLFGHAGIDYARYYDLHTLFDAVDLGNGSYQIVDLRSGAPEGTDTFWDIERFIFDDGTFTLAQLFNVAPLATVADHTLQPGEWSLIAGWLSYSDVEGDPATQYQFWDGGNGANGGYVSTPGNAHHPVQTTITVNAADLDDVWVRGGQTGGPQTMWVRASDSFGGWGAWDSFVLTTLNTPPAAAIANHTLLTSQWVQVSGWLSYSDADGNAAVRYQFMDGGAGASSGYFWTPTNAHHAANTSFEVAASDLASVWLRGGQSAGTETISVRAFDGTNWSAWDTFTLTTQLNTAPVATINDHGLRVNEWSQLIGWLSYSDADANPAVRYQFEDQGAGATSGYFWTPANAHHAANTPFEVAASDLGSVWLRGGQTSGTETIRVRAFDGTDWGAWDTFTFATELNSAPVATINDHHLRPNEWSQLTGWLFYLDVNGDAAVRYQFDDQGAGATSGYFWTPDNAHHAANTPFEVAASDLTSVWLRGGQTNGTETIRVRAFDGIDWGAWDTFTFATQANMPPVATINDHSLHLNEWSQLTSWISFSDADGDTAVRYQFEDQGAGSTSGYFWTPTNAHHAANTPFEVAASDLASVWLRGGQTNGTETIRVRAFDGTDWSAWDTFTFTTVANTAPVATISDHSLRVNEWSDLTGWISYADADGNAAVMYEFIDGGTGATSGYFWTPANAHHAASTPFQVAASELGHVRLRGGQAAGTETISVRAFDGTDWGAWDTFTFTTQLNTAPVVTVDDHSLHLNEWTQLPGSISFADANGDRAARYQFRDDGPGATSGYFWTPDNAHHAANTPFEIAAADLANVWLRGGQSAGTETISVRAFDGTDWSAWDTFTLNTLV